MNERVALFKQRYPYSHCTIYKLRKLYKKTGIKRKMIRRVKIIPPRSHRAAIDEVMDLLADVRSAVLQGFRIV